MAVRSEPASGVASMIGVASMMRTSLPDGVVGTVVGRYPGEGVHRPAEHLAISSASGTAERARRPTIRPVPSLPTWPAASREPRHGVCNRCAPTCTPYLTCMVSTPSRPPLLRRRARGAPGAIHASRVVCRRPGTFFSYWGCGRRALRTRIVVKSLLLGRAGTRLRRRRQSCTRRR